MSEEDCNFYPYCNDIFGNIETLVIDGIEDGIIPWTAHVEDYQSESVEYNENENESKDNINSVTSNFKSMYIYSNLKRLDLFRCNLSYDSLNKADIDVFLQMIIPQSPKDLELKHRLNNKITEDIKKKKQLWQIEEMKQNIKHDIDKKYKPKFDENELTLKNSQKSHYQWHSSIEMLSFVDFDHLYNLEMDDPMSNHLKNELKLNNSQRIKNGLSTLQSLECKQLSIILRDEYFNPLSLYLTTDIYIISAILNNTGYQLISLHVDNSMTQLWDWNFIKNNYPCTKTSLQESWFPLNVQHLCWKQNNTTDKEPFWYKINSTMFPKLKHLKIIDDADSMATILNNTNENKHERDLKKQEIVTNISSLVSNGLESLHIEVNRLSGIDFESSIHLNKNKSKNKNKKQNFRKIGVNIDQFLNLLSDIFNLKKRKRLKNDDGNDKNKNQKPNKKQLLIVKIGLNAQFSREDVENDWFDAKNEEYFEKLCLQLLGIYSWMRQKYCNAMFGFRLNVQIIDDVEFGFSNVQWLLNKMRYRFQDQLVFEKDEARTVDKVFKTNVEKCQAVFGAIIKNENLGQSNTSCQCCHMEPKYRYQCDDCRSVPWLDIM